METIITTPRSATTFQQKLAVGRVGESVIAQWLKTKGYSILPVYEIEINSGKGPRLFGPRKNYIAPDMLAFRDDKTIWIEAKHKTAFSWHRNSDRWVTGIDLTHYADYCEIDAHSPFRVWLMFLHTGGQAKDSPANSPAGLFGNSISYLRNHENHRSDRWGSGGMVYWNVGELKKLAEISEVI